jgi:hypothetical protein
MEVINITAVYGKNQMLLKSNGLNYTYLSLAFRFLLRLFSVLTDANDQFSWITFKLIIQPIIYLSIYLWLCSPCGPWPRFQLLNLYTVGRTPWTGDQPVTRPLPTHGTTQTQNKRTQTSMPWVGFEPTIPAFERAKAIHALDRAATVIGIQPTTTCRELH